MPSLMIQPTRTEVTRTFPVLGFTVRTGFAPAWFEVAIATDPALFEASARSHRTPATFYSSRVQGPLPAERGEAVYLVPQAVLDRFAGQEHLYYALAAYRQPAFSNPQLLTPPGSAAPSVYVSRSFIGQSRRLTLRPNRRGGVTGRDGAYVDESPDTLVWGGDDAVAGSSQPVAVPAASAPSAKAIAPAAPAHAAGLDSGYDDGFGALPPRAYAAEDAGGDAAAADDSSHDIGGPISDSGDAGDAGAAGAAGAVGAAGAQALTITAPEYPQASRFVPANPGNYRAVSGQRTINRVVIHITDGSRLIGGTIDWFKNPAAKVSAHYIVGQDGEVVQMVANNDVAWHAGRANGDSIGIEHVASRQRNIFPTDTQYCASAALVNWLCSQFNITMDRVHVLGHSEADPGTTHSGCPNSVWDWTRYMPMVTSGQCTAPAAGSSGDAGTQAQSLSVRTRALDDMDGGTAGGPSDAGLPGGVATPPPPAQPATPPAQVRISTAHVWIKAFIKPARVDGPPGFHCFAGDDRDFSNDPNAAARITSELWIEGLGTTSPTVRQRSHCDPSRHVACDGSQTYSTATGDASRCHFGALQYDVASAVATLPYVMAASNPLVPLSPDADVNGTFTIDAVNGTVAFNGLVDQYPWFEAYADGVTIFTASPLPGKDAYNLVGDANKPASGTAQLGAAAAQSLALALPEATAHHHVHHHHANGNGHGHAQSLDAPQSVDFNWDVPLVAQTTDSNCWAAAAAMVRGWHDSQSVPVVETAPNSYEDCARAYNLAAEPLQSNPVDRWRQLLMMYGPLWVCADQPFQAGPGFHAVVITGIKSDGAPDGSDTCFRIADPWDRAGGLNPPPHPGTHNSGSRYMLTFARFLQEFEAAVRNPNNDWTWVRIMHCPDQTLRMPAQGDGTAAAQALGWTPVPVEHVAHGAPRGTAATVARAQAVPAAVIAIASPIVDTTMTRVLNNEGDIKWELDQLQGLQHPGDNPANQGTGRFKSNVTEVPGPHAATLPFHVDHIYADFRVTWESNGRSLGNVTIVNTKANDAIGAGLDVKAVIRREANAYTRPGNPDSFAAIHIQFSYHFNYTVGNDDIALTELTLYGDGTFSSHFEWTQ